MLHERINEKRMNGKVSVINTEVTPKAERRKFTAAYKVRVLDEVDQCTEPGEIGAVIRREGLYSSQVSQWRRQRDGGGLSGLTPQKRGRKKDEQAAELAKLQRENARLRKQLGQAELIIAAQKKLAQALEALTDQDDEMS